jgi:hypothetical protein
MMSNVVQLNSLEKKIMFFNIYSRIILATIMVCVTPVSQAVDSLKYQPRGDRWEGVAPSQFNNKPDIELLSAIVDNRENWWITPPHCKLKFYLPSITEVDLRVRELRPQHFYKMDNVIQSWQQGFNDYQWPTHQVIKPLGIKLGQLGVVARLKKSQSRDTEHVAPVIFYQNNPPTSINGYLFTFQVNGQARLSYAIYQRGQPELPITDGSLGQQYAGKPFVVFWDSSQAEEGFYELVVDGYFLNNFMLIYQAVEFYHKPSVD